MGDKGNFSIEKLLAQKFEMPEFKEPQNQQELVEQLAIISLVTERCEKILSHLILSKDFDCKEMKEYMEAHIHLVGRKNKLVKKQRKMQTGKDLLDSGVDSDLTLDRIEQ